MKPRPIVLLILFLVMALLAWRNEKLAMLGRSAVDAKLRGDAVVLTWRSGVRAPMAAEFADAYAEWAGQTDRFVIALHSPGGSLTEGAAVVDVIERMKRTHQVDTYVAGGDACLSMCVPIFLRGEERRAGRSARFMFHEPSAYDAVTGEPVKQPRFEKDFTTERYYRRFFGDSPMDPAWGEDLKQQWRDKDIWKSAGQLVDEGANVVTDLR